MYIYIYIEREREIFRYNGIYIYIYICWFQTENRSPGAFLNPFFTVCPSCKRKLSVCKRTKRTCPSMLMCHQDPQFVSSNREILGITVCYRTLQSVVAIWTYKCFIFIADLSIYSSSYYWNFLDNLMLLKLLFFMHWYTWTVKIKTW